MDDKPRKGQYGKMHKDVRDKKGTTRRSSVIKRAGNLKYALLPIRKYKT